MGQYYMVFTTIPIYTVGFESMMAYTGLMSLLIAFILVISF